VLAGVLLHVIPSASKVYFLRDRFANGKGCWRKVNSAKAIAVNGLDWYPF
jgi:hypothetical protein